LFVLGYLFLNDMRNSTIIIFLLFFLFSCNNKNEKIKYISPENNNTVVNVTKWDDIDLYSQFALDKLNVGGVSVVVTYIPNKMVQQYEQENNVYLEGFIVELSLNRFQILINKDLSVFNLRRVVFHEIIHLKQVTSGRLVTCNADLIEFEKNSYYVKYVPYRYRPWEMEAYKYEKYMLSLNNFYE
jgi:predicted metallopeptidase